MLFRTDVCPIVENKVLERAPTPGPDRGGNPNPLGLDGLVGLVGLGGQGRP